MAALAVGAVALSMWGYFLIRAERAREHAAFAAYLARRGWRPIEQLPRRAAKVLDEVTLRGAAGLSRCYTCLHTYQSGPTDVHIGVCHRVTGRGSMINMVDVATDKLRAPLACLITTGRRDRDVWRQSTTIQVSADRPGGRPLFVRFEGKRSPNDREVRQTLRIVGILFHGMEDAFDRRTGAALGRRGLFINGPFLRVAKGGRLSVERLVELAERAAREAPRVHEVNEN